MGYINVTYFAMTVFPLWYYWSVGEYTTHPPALPHNRRVAAYRCDDPLQPPYQIMGVKMHRTPSCVHLKWKYNIQLPPKERPSRAKATRLQVVNMSWWIKYLTGDCFESWSNQRATYHIYSGSWFFARFYCLHFHPLLWCLIWTF